MSKLCEKGYKNIYSFSYGLKNNSDSLVAKKVAEHLGVKWNFFEFNRIKFRKMYFSSFKYNYDKFSDHFSVLPNYQDLFFLKIMQDENFFKKKAILVNGQSGDFNSGMHIPKSLNEFDRNFSNKYKDILLESINKKHFILSDTLNNKIHEEANNSLKFIIDKTCGSFVSDIYESWEYEERQCKYVVNGQRAYEYLDLDWSLPLWDSSFVKFWTTIPLKYRFNQKLYREYLMDWNYNNVFQKINKTVTAFTGYQKFVVMFISIFLGRIIPKEHKERLLGYLDYFSRLGISYQYFNFGYFLKNRYRVKNAIPFHIEEWLKKNLT